MDVLLILLALVAVVHTVFDGIRIESVEDEDGNEH